MKIAVAGGYGVGMTMRVANAPEPGETVTGGILSIGHGGKGSNQAVGAARLGCDVALFTAIGEDSAGSEARKFWQAENINSGGVIVSDAPTMTGFIIVDDSGENRIAIAPGALDALKPEDAERFRKAIGEAELLVVSLEIPVAVATKLLAIAREEGTRTLLNPAPASPLPDEAWASIDFLTPNQSEAAILLGVPADELDNVHAAACRLQERFGGTVVLTAGSQGAIIAEGDGSISVPAHPVETVVDTTGAGDAFTAAFAVATVEGKSAVEAAKFAAAAGAHAVTIAEVIPSLAHRKQLEEFIISKTKG